MKIYRDGKEIELTFSEMIQANEEYNLDCMIEDIDSILGSEERDVELSNEQIKEVAMLAVHNLDKNDSHFEAYWASVEYTLDDYINNLPIDEEEDN